MTDEVEQEIVETEEKEQDEFDQAFNEAATAREGGEDTEISDDDLDPAPDDVVDTVAETDANKEKPAEVDELEGWSEDQKTKYNELQTKNNDLEHRIKSDNGRVGAFQRKVNNLEHQIAEIQQKPGQPSTADITAAMGDDESWKTFEEDYPEIAGVMNKRFDAQAAHIDETMAPVITKQKNDAAEAAETAQTENYTEVAKVYPKWQDAVNQPEFNDWMASQSPGVQALAGSDDTRDASLLISKYDDFRVENGHTTLKADPEPDGGSVDDEVEDEVTKRRAQQLEDGVTIESKKARIDPNAESEGEFEDAFNAFAARKETANNRA